MNNEHTYGFADDGERYRLDGRIATGGMGEVWRATDTTLGREVAVKLLKMEFSDDATFRYRFETEARHAASLHHPNIAAVYDVGERSTADGAAHPQPFLVMELVPGEPLSALVRVGQGLDPDATRGLLSQAADGLGAAHRAGIIHRDIKPANLLVTPDRLVKITDFGIARAAEAVGITRTGAVMGTPQYLSPEQAEGRPATPASDVYALGVVAFECLAGRRPFEAESPVATALAHIREPIPALPDDVPKDLADVVTRALAKDPAERFADGAAFAVALRDPHTAAVARPAAPVVPVPAEDRTQVLSDLPGTTPPARPPRRPAPTPKREPEKKSNPWPVVVAVLLAAALVAAVVLLLTRNGGDSSDTAEDPAPPRRTTSSTQAPTTAATTPSEPTSEPTTEAPATAEIDQADVVNSTVAQAQTFLRSLGFTNFAEPEALPNDDPARNGLVARVTPTGEQPLDVEILISYYEDAAEPTPPPTTDIPTDVPTTEAPPTDMPSDPATTEGQTN